MPILAVHKVHFQVVFNNDKREIISRYVKIHKPKRDCQEEVVNT